MRILFDSKNPKYKTPFGCLKTGEICRIRIDIPSSCGAKSVRIILNGERNFCVELKKTLPCDCYDVFSCEFKMEETGLYFYYFHIEDEKGGFDLYKQNLCDTNMGSGDLWQLSVIPKNYLTPDEFKGGVMYQIFPDRFSKDGECTLTDKLPPFEIHKDTGEIPHFRPNSNGEVLNNDFYGGNLKGIEKELPYLSELGVNIIYLNPIFKAFSNHRYDTCDYKQIDPMLGTEEDFVSLCKEAHNLGIKIILDGVFSHTGSDSIYFDIKNRFGGGAYHNLDSPYRSWYNFFDDKRYESWWGISTLPCVNEMNKSFIDYIIKDEDSVIKHWLKLGADGFRLDVADELPDEFIELLRYEVKKTKPNAIVIGEVWEDASNKISYQTRRKYFTNGELDSVMNYPFREAIIELSMERISVSDFARRIMTITENYPKETLSCLMNSLSTHDTPRIMTVLSGAPMDLSRDEAFSYKLSDKEIQNARQRIKLAAVLQFFLPGIACIYYGDELGSFGFGDPFNRGYFEKDKMDYEIFDFYKSLCKIKNTNKLFISSDLSLLKCDEDILIMERSDNTDSICLAINLSNIPLKIKASSAFICNNTTCMNTTFYVQKYGFVLY